MNLIAKRVRAFWDPSAWIMIAIGIILFSIRVPFAPGGFIDFPAAFTVFQTGGLMFAVFGMQLMASMAFWPDLNFGAVLQSAVEGSTAAALIVMGLLVFNGLCVVGFAYWLTSALGMAAAK